MKKMPTHAMVMAAGLGLRMRPLSDLPKPMIPVAGVPLIDRTLDWVVASGVQHAVVNTHYRADVMEAHLQQRDAPEITISHEDELLETGGGIVKALPHLGRMPFFAINSDTICVDGAKPALKCMAEMWDSSRMDILMLLHPTEQAVGYDGEGDFSLDSAGHLQRRKNNQSAPYVFTGVQLLNPDLFRDAKEEKFSLNVFYDKALQAQPEPRIFGLVHDGAWLHVGNPQGVTQAESYFEQASSALQKQTSHA